MQKPRNRTEQERYLRSFGWQHLSDAQFDKCEYLERKIKATTGEHLPLDRIERVDDIEFYPDLIQEGCIKGKDPESLNCRNYGKIKWNQT